MLCDIDEFIGNKIIASDGHIGHVRDFYLDATTWMIRYLIADAGTWLPGREVLLSPYCFGSRGRDKKIFNINLSRQQIEGSPRIDLQQPVSRHFEEQYYFYYGWPSYWQGGGTWGEIGFPIPSPAVITAASAHHRIRGRFSSCHLNDVHFFRLSEVVGYDIQAADGLVGSVTGFMADDKSWATVGLVAEAGHWFSCNDIPIPVSSIERINDEESTVYVKLTKAEIQAAAENQTIKDKAQAAALLHSHGFKNIQ